VFEVNIAAVLLVSLVIMVVMGVHIAVALGVASALGIYLVTGNFAVVERMLASTAYEALRDYVFAVIPLFMLMGEFIARSGAVTDVYRGINRGLKRIPGRLALATVLGNALFSLVTGVSIASAAAFSRISYPEMKRHGYHRTLRARHHRRILLPGHADSAQRADDRLGHPDGKIHRSAVPRRRHSRPHGGRDVLSLHPGRRRPAPDARRRSGSRADGEACSRRPIEDGSEATARSAGSGPARSASCWWW
jgi:hypothetical protein